MGKYAFVFSGQGSQYVGMCKELYKNSHVAKNIFDLADEILGFKISELCFTGNEDILSNTINAQLAVFTASCAQLKDFFNKHDCTPEIVAGNSVGEYVALVCAGVLSFKDALLLVKSRAELMHNAASVCSGTMAVVRNIEFSLINDEINKLSKENDEILCISNFNAKNNVTVSGTKSSVNLLCEALKKKGAEVIPLKVSSGFHSELMQSAADKFVEIVNSYTFNEPNCSVMSNVTGKPYKSVQEIISLLPLQIVKPVKWHHIMEYIENQKISSTIEFGAKSTLRNYFLNNTLVDSYSYDIDYDKIKIDNLLKVDNLSIPALCLGVAVATKNKNTDTSCYSECVIKPYRIIEKINNSNFNSISKDDINTCYLKLKEILEYKLLPSEEINLVMGRIFGNELGENI